MTENKVLTWHLNYQFATWTKRMAISDVLLFLVWGVCVCVCGWVGWCGHWPCCFCWVWHWLSLGFLLPSLLSSPAGQSKTQSVSSGCRGPQGLKEDKQGPLQQHLDPVGFTKFFKSGFWGSKKFHFSSVNHLPVENPVLLWHLVNSMLKNVISAWT